MVIEHTDHKAMCVDDEGSLVCSCELRHLEDEHAAHIAGGFAMLAEAMK